VNLDVAWLIPALPLLSFVLIVFFLNRYKRVSGYVAVTTILIGLALSLGVLSHIAVSSPNPENPFTYQLWNWVPVGLSWFSFGILIDPLTCVMIMVVTLVGSCIFVYSLGYMHGDPRYSRFFAFMSLFAMSMLMLVMANNLVMLYIGWELVGLCSYLLIGFWFERPSAADAAKKAFIVTRIGDVGLFLGILVLYVNTGHIDFVGIFQKIPELAAANPNLVTLAALLVFSGAVGKSAQFPLHVWLPDAMEGPTPVSALIHAATMVAAGVYLVARMYPVFSAVNGSPSLQVVAWIGAVTAVMGASIGIAMNRAKRILAYSTISQLGYMMIGLGVGGVAVGIFHLMTHAFFKALLFLGAGSMMHGSGEHADLDIYKAGGLRKAMPITFWTFLFGTLALAGIFPFAGFWSKDAILGKAFDKNLLIYLLGLAGVFLTAFYMFRLIFVAFFGEQRDHSVHVHESPRVMTWPLIVLAFFSLVLGFVGISFAGNQFAHFLGGTLGAEAAAEAQGASTALELTLMAVSTIVALSGVYVAYRLYGVRQVATAAEEPLRRLGPIYTALENKLYFDRIYGATVVRGSLAISSAFRWFDENVIDGLVNAAGKLTVVFSRISRWIDVNIVDGLVNFIGWLTGKVGGLLRNLQTGQIQNYLMLVLIGVILMAIVYLYR
jgi:NADH-quinone oxidoreductase subunit L